MDPRRSAPDSRSQRRASRRHPLQQKHRGYNTGFIVTNPNCSTAGLVLVLKPLADAFGLEKIFVVTLQAVSGAGYPGVASMDIHGNVVPFISGEEEKMESEPQKLLGKWDGKRFVDAGLGLSAHCNRVPVPMATSNASAFSLKKDRLAPKRSAKPCAPLKSVPSSPSLPSAIRHPSSVLDDEEPPAAAPRCHTQATAWPRRWPRARMPAARHQAHPCFRTIWCAVPPAQPYSTPSCSPPVDFFKDRRWPPQRNCKSRSPSQLSRFRPGSCRVFVGAQHAAPQLPRLKNSEVFPSDRRFLVKFTPRYGKVSPISILFQ